MKINLNQKLILRLNQYFLVSFLMILLFLLFLGCNNSITPEIYWVRGPEGTFYTNDINRAQKEIPFTIIFPEYLPEKMNPGYPGEIYGPIKGPDIGVGVEISYANDNTYIIIREFNELQIMGPNEEAEPEYFNIAGVKVLKQLTSMSDGLSFDWNMNGFTYWVEIFPADKVEGKKIVESMIKQ